MTTTINLISVQKINKTFNIESISAYIQDCFLPYIDQMEPEDLSTFCDILDDLNSLEDIESQQLKEGIFDTLEYIDHPFIQELEFSFPNINFSI